MSTFRAMVLVTILLVPATVFADVAPAVETTVAQASFYDIWPLSVGNWWWLSGDSGGSYEVVRHDIVNGVGVWVLEFWCNYCEGPGQMYLVQSDGWIWRTSHEEDLALLPVMGGSFCPAYPVQFSSGDAMEASACNGYPAVVTLGRLGDLGAPSVPAGIDPDTECAAFAYYDGYECVGRILFARGIGPVYSEMFGGAISCILEDYNVVPDASVLKVVSPNGGGSWAPGLQHAITWDLGRAYYGDAAIWLYNNWTKVRRLAVAPITDGTWIWAVPADEPQLTTYRIRVQSMVNGAISDYSDSTFAIRSGPPSLMVTAPKGGESWQRGTQHAVTWTSANLSGNARVYLYYNWTKVRVLATLPIAAGGYMWNIPATEPAGTAYRIRVQSLTDTAVQDYSNAVFSIAP